VSNKKDFNRFITPKSRRKRIRALFLVLSLWVVVLVFRLYSIQISSFSVWQEWALKQHFTEIKIASERASIIDRFGRKLAKSIPVKSVYLRPSQIKKKENVVKVLARELNFPPKKIYSLLKTPKPFIWLKRQVPLVQIRNLEQLKLSGVGFISESKRAYPYNDAGSILLGKVSIDGNGLSGLEKVYDSRLKASEYLASVTRDGLGNRINVTDKAETKNNQSLQANLKLTIDGELQTIMHDELELGRKENKAKSVTAIMVEGNSGEVLAMGQSPSLNLNDAKIKSEKDLINLAVESSFEPGSVLKPIVAALAIDSGVVDEEDVLDCEHGRRKFAGYFIKDTHPLDLVTFRQVMVRSSNIGMSKVAERLGKERLFYGLKSFGFGERTNIGLPAEASGIFRGLASWADIDLATHSYGQGISVTPLQIVRAISAIANGGNLVPLRIVANASQVAPSSVRLPQRVISEVTAEKIKSLMEAVVAEKEGTGKNASLENIRVAGKTGTAEKAVSGVRGYAHGKYVSSFVGFVESYKIGLPYTLVLYVIVDEPNGKSTYGGTVAAPIFKRILTKSLAYLSRHFELSESENHNKKPIKERSFNIVTSKSTDV
jgi:cell division protein FtsI (penicillin-binding protein 3)